jgi:hypothetical protein
MAMEDPLGAARRHLSAILAAISFLGLLKTLNVVTWQKNVNKGIDAYQSFSRPVAAFLFGWIPNLFGLHLPGWLMDYLLAGVIVFLALVRAYKFIDIELKQMIGALLKDLLICVVFWPAVVLQLLAFVVSIDSGILDNRIPKERNEVVYKRKFLIFGRWTPQMTPIPEEERRETRQKAARASLAMFLYFIAFLIVNYALIVAGAFAAR